MGAVVLEQPRMLMKLLAQMEAFNGYGGSCYALARSDGWTGSWTAGAGQVAPPPWRQKRVVSGGLAGVSPGRTT